MKKYFALSIALLALASCSPKKVGSERADDYAASLNDSIAAINAEIDSCENNLQILHDRVAEWLRDFTAVSNPREAGTYWIFTKFRDRYPLKGNGVITRINDNGQLELIAALKGAPFDKIAVRTGETTIMSDTVPNDQALNYRVDGFSTVLFTGPRAVEIAKTIADNQLNHVAINYYGSNLILSWTVPQDVKEMIMSTYMLYSSQQDAARLEKRIPMLHEKINLIRTHQAAQKEGQSEDK